jgi:hypothetical protein
MKFGILSMRRFLQLGGFEFRVMAAVCLVIAAGCKPADVNVYYVSKDPHAGMERTELPAGHPPMGGQPMGARAKWTMPVGWTEAPLGSMRVASFRIASNDKRAEVSVIPLAGTGGGDLENVNRWRGEVGLAPITDDELKKQAQPVQVDGQAASLFEMDGKTADGTAGRVVAAIQHRDGTAWFFKMAGDNELVAQHKSSFVSFLESFQFLKGDETPPQTVSRPRASGEPQWDVPSGWKEGPAGQFLTAKFIIQGDGNTRAEVNVSNAAGDGGGFAANVNRWRQQIGLNAMSPDELVKASKTIEVTKGIASVVEMRGTDARTGNPASVVGVIVMQEGRAWFYKLAGDEKVVEAQRETFLQFVQGVRY